jgi:hypothetical protein
MHGASCGTSPVLPARARLAGHRPLGSGDRIEETGVASVIAFDANDTLLDLFGSDEPVERVFGSRSVRRWRSVQMAQLAFGGTVSGPQRS